MQYKDNSSFDKCKSLWIPIINMVLSFCEKLKPALSAGGLDSKEKANNVMKDVGSIINYVTMASGGVSKENISFLNTLKY